MFHKGRSALEAVKSALANSKTDAVAKRHLVWVLDAIAGGTPEATSALIGALTDASADVRAQAARALGERAVKAGAEPIEKLVHDADPTVRLQALIALGRIGEPSSVPAIVPLVADSDPYLAFSARRALKRIGDWKRAASGLSSSDAKARLGLLLAMEMVYQIDAARTLAAFAEDSSREPSERARALYLLAQGHRKPIPWNGKWWGTQPARTKRPVKNGDWEGTGLVLAAVSKSLSDPAPAVRIEAVKAERDVADPSTLAGAPRAIRQGKGRAGTRRDRADAWRAGRQTGPPRADRRDEGQGHDLGRARRRVGECRDDRVGRGSERPFWIWSSRTH